MGFLAGKRVLITGAATGIGRATALRFAEEGASVAVNFVGDREPAEALVEELAETNPEGVHILAPADVADEDTFVHFGKIRCACNRVNWRTNISSVSMHSPKPYCLALTVLTTVSGGDPS